MKRIILAIAIVSVSISTISCTADELPTQPQEQNTELNSLDGGGNGATNGLPPIKG